MFSEFFIHRPKFAFVISILMMLAGAICLTKMPIAEYPEISPPTIAVSMSFPGASSEELAQVVAAPVEEQLIGVDDMEYFSSTCSSDGFYSLRIVFKAGTDDDMALINVSNAIKRMESRLPAEIKQTGYTVSKRSSDMLCMLSFMADPNKMSNLELTNWLRMNLKDKVGKINGVSAVDLRPDRSYSMRVWMNTTRMSALNIVPKDITLAINQQNIQAAAGSVGAADEQAYATFKITAVGRLKTIEEFGNIIVKRGENGHVTRLRDIATIELGSESYSSYSRFNGIDSVGFHVSRNNEANALITVEAVKDAVKALEPSFPEGMTWTISYDPTEAITATMKEIIITLILSLTLVVLVTFAFLQDWRATIIPALTIPVSLLGAFTVMLMLGYSINVLTMFGLILVIGSLVDDAIVVVENVMRIMAEEKLPAMEATIKSMEQITGAVLATTLVTLAIYVPIAFYGGMVGVIYTQFSVTMCIALCISTFNALTLSPALCAILLRPIPEKRSLTTRIVFAPFNVVLDFCRTIYLAGVRILVKHAWLTVLIFAGLIAGNYYYYNGAPKIMIMSAMGIPKELANDPAAIRKHMMEQKQKAAKLKAEKQKNEKNIAGVQQEEAKSKINWSKALVPTALNSSFVPIEDKGAIFVMVTLEGSATVKKRTDAVLREMEARIATIPGVEGFVSSAGFSFMGSGENNAMFIVILDNWEKRPTPDLHVTAIQQKINQVCADIPEANIMAMTPPAIMGLGIAGGVSMILQVSGDATPQDLGNMVKEVSARLQERRDLVMMTRSEYNAETAQIHLEINREKAQSLNIPVNNIFSTLQSMMASTYVNDFTLHGFSFKVKIQGNAQDRRLADEILNVLVRSETGEMVPLSAVCSLSYKLGPATYERFNQLMSASISVNPMPGVGSGQVMELIEQTIQDINTEDRAAGHNRTWQVDWEAMSFQERQNTGKMGALLAMAILFAYLFLVAQYESWTTPIPVIFSVSVATLGALMGAQIFGLSLSIYVQLGILMLVGLASKNAILIVEFCKDDHCEHHTPIAQAALNGADKRFRAVLMTAISFLCGVFPMMIATGAGAASRQEIGITTFCGMLLATVWGIFMVPALYSICARMRDATARAFGKETP